MIGNDNKKIIVTNSMGTVFRNFDFKVWDLIIHPKINNNKDIIRTIDNINNEDIKVIKNTDVIMFSKLWI